MSMLHFDPLREAIEHKLSELVLKSPHALIEPLFEAARYSLLSSGKRFRPLLTLVAAQTYGAPLETALIPACALELIHTYSLIHDDLPCMDDDDLRRGKPTLHKVYNEGHALLTGDFLLTYAFEVISKAPALSAEVKLTLIRVLAESAGANGMVGGQLIDIAIQDTCADLETLLLMHSKKTAALFSAALTFGGLIGAAPTDDLFLLKQIGDNLGSAFQIFDDLVDAGDGKSSCLQQLAPQKAEELAEEKLALIKRDLNSLSKAADPLESLVCAIHKQFR